MRNSTPEYDLSDAAWRWRKSSYSGGEGSDCLEVTYDHPGLIPVRDSKDPAGPTLTFRAAAWSAFVAGLARQA
ncbi:DUF397 domain-containing protein [Streptomyces sp. NPDC050095]|uniref:DUF397 domain-containing protein n=1 Tax=unclassified Streptomyces TaxID=2593676 RepID=UPI00341C6F75